MKHTDMEQPDEIRGALRQCASALMAVGLMSGMSNLLMLTGSFFMLEVYDRVLPSRSVYTLIGLGVITMVLFGFQALMDMTRSRIMVRLGSLLDAKLSHRVYKVGLRLAQVGHDGAQPSRDLDQIRSFLQSGGPTAFFDLPWIPLYAGLCFMFHPWIGVAVLAGATLLVIPTLVTEIVTRRATTQLTQVASQRGGIFEASRRNAEVLLASGMAETMGKRWSKVNAQYIDENRRISDLTGGFSAMTKAMRMALQSGVLGLGAYLVIKGEATAGIIIASSILSARALAPVEATIANWKGFAAARQGKQRLRQVLNSAPEPIVRTSLPAPTKVFAAETVAVAPPGASKTVIEGVDFVLTAGDGLGIIGPSASGKSSLVRALVGLWSPVTGKVRLDGAALEQWNLSERCQHIGYLPQDVELFAGTVAENIASFQEDVQAKDVVKAATMAGVHEMILRLIDGYETQIGHHGQALSAGQRQRIALARALYNDPFVVVLDEPNSNLDQEGELALSHAIAGIRRRGGVAIVVAHRPAALSAVNLVMIVTNGRMQKLGSRDEILSKVTPMSRRPSAVAG